VDHLALIRGTFQVAFSTLASQPIHPANRDTLLALVTINRDAGRFAGGLAWADRLVALDSAARKLHDQIARFAVGQ
jgi:hypothetical protein